MFNEFGEQGDETTGAATTTYAMLLSPASSLCRHVAVNEAAAPLAAL
jgi:hypothetical protein